MQEHTFTTGESGNLTCNITLNVDLGQDASSLSVMWYHNNVAVTESDEYSISAFQRNTNSLEYINTLKIANISTSHGGRYSCNCKIGETQEKSDEKEICVKSISHMHNKPLIELKIIYTAIILCLH